MAKWAVKFGEELWELAETMTKANDIKQVIKNKLFVSQDSSYEQCLFAEIQIIQCTSGTQRWRHFN